MLARTSTCCPLWAKRHPAVAVAEHRAAHPGVIVFKVKYQWPEEGWLKLEISPLIQTRPFRAQQTHRLIEAAYGKNCGD